MKKLVTILLAMSALIPTVAFAQDYNVWVTTEGSGVMLSSGRHMPPPPPVPCRHSHHCKHHKKHIKEMRKAEKKRAKQLQKAHKKYQKAQREYIRELNRR